MSSRGIKRPHAEVDATPAYTPPDAAMRARMDALDPPVSAAAVQATNEKGAKLLAAACEQGDLPRAWALLELGADATVESYRPGPSLYCAKSCVEDARLVEPVELLLAHGADPASIFVLRAPFTSAPVARALLAGGLYPKARPAVYAAALPQEKNSPGALRALAEAGGSELVWVPGQEDEEGCVPLHSHARHNNAANTEVSLALMLTRPPADVAAGSADALTTALDIRNSERAAPLAMAGNAPTSAALLLACGAPCGGGLVEAFLGRLGGLYTKALPVILAHAAAVLPGPKPAGVPVQHARDLPLFTGRVAAWEGKRRVAIDKEHANTFSKLPAAGLTDAQRAQRVLLIDEHKARKLAALEEDLAAWAWARGVVASAVAALAASPAPPPLPTFAEWFNACDENECTGLGYVTAQRSPHAVLPLLRYGARIDGENALVCLLLHGPGPLRAALTDCGAAAAPGFVMNRACAAGAVAAAVAEYAGLREWQREDRVEPDTDALLAAFDECMQVRVKRISQGLKRAVPLPAQSTHNAPLDIVSAYLGFSLAVGPLPLPQQQ